MAENRELALVLKLVADQFKNELSNSQGALGTFNNFIKDWKTQLTAVGVALFAIAKSTANFGEEALKGAQRTGQTVEAYTALSYSAKQADIDQQQLTIGLKTLSQNMAEAAQHTGDGAALFDRLNISTTDTTGKLRPVGDVLLDIADAFQKHADGAGKNDVAVKLFSKAWQGFLPWMNLGSKAIRDQQKDAKDLAVTMTQEQAVAAAKLAEEIKRLDAAMRGLTLSVGAPLATAFSSGLEIITKMSVEMKKLDDQTTNSAQNLKNWSDAFGQTKMGQGLMDAFTALGLGHRKGEGTLPREQFWFNLLGMPAPGSGVLAPGADSAAKADTGATKPQMPLGPSKLAADQLQAQFAAKEKAIQDELELVKTGFDRQRLLVEASVAEGQTLDSQAAEAHQTIKNQELASEVENFQKLKILTESFYQQRQVLGFKDADERLKVETEYRKNVAQFDQQAKLVAAAITNEKLRGDIEAGQARAREAKASLDLLFQGANLIKADRQEQQTQLVANLQAWLHYGEVLGASTEFMLDKRLDLVRAELAKELDITQDLAGKLMIAEQNKDQDALDSLRLRIAKSDQVIETSLLNAQVKYRGAVNELSGDFFAGWAEGMKNYVRDAKSGFGLAADMARRSFQTIEQNASKFFFDAMEGRIQRFKDVMTSFLNFAKQIASQLAGQLITKQIAGALVGGFPNLFGPITMPTPNQYPYPIGPFPEGGVGAAMGGLLVQRFAVGGPVLGAGNRDTIPALLTPGEFVLSRRDVSDIKSGLGVGAGVQVINNNYTNAQIETSTSRSPDGQLVITQVIRETVRGLVRSGELDGSFNQRFGFNPQAARR